MDFYNILLAKKVHYAIALMNFGIGRLSAKSWTIVERKAVIFPQRASLWKVGRFDQLIQEIRLALLLWLFSEPRNPIIWKNRIVQAKGYLSTVAKFPTVSKVETIALTKGGNQ